MSINCYSKEANMPAKPLDLLEMERDLDESKNSESRIKMTDNQGQTYIIHYKTAENEQQHITYEEEEQQKNMMQPPANQPGKAQSKLVNDPVNFNAINNEVQKDMVNAFLRGDQCLNGVGIFFKNYRDLI